MDLIKKPEKKLEAKDNTRYVFLHSVWGECL